jgi:hypothetical protein
LIAIFYRKDGNMKECRAQAVIKDFAGKEMSKLSLRG